MLAGLELCMVATHAGKSVGVNIRFSKLWKLWDLRMIVGNHGIQITNNKQPFEILSVGLENSRDAQQGQNINVFSNWYICWFIHDIISLKSNFSLMTTISPLGPYLNTPQADHWTKGTLSPLWLEKMKMFKRAITLEHLVSLGLKWRFTVYFLNICSIVVGLLLTSISA